MYRFRATAMQGYLLVAILAAIVLSVTFITTFSLYRTALEGQRARLVETAQSQARLMEAIARFDRIHAVHDPDRPPFESTLSQIRDAHENFKGFGETGEFTLARREGNQIVFLLSHRFADLNKLHPVAFDSKKAEPMRRALRGESGSMIGLDYHGDIVLAAYEPVAQLNLGVVAKIDMAEVRAPFIRTGSLAIFIASILIFIGAWLFRRITHPMLKRLETSEERLKIATDGTHEGFWLWDIKTEHSWFAPNFKSLLGYAKDEAFPEEFSTWESRIHPEDKERVLESLKQHLENNVTYDCDHRLRMKSGEYKWFRDRGVAVRDDSGQPIQMGGSIQDINDLKQAEEQLKLRNEELQKLSLHDSLTGIANRRMFDRLLEIEWARAQRSKQMLSLLFIDIDFLKQYNDHYGHQAGDACLKQIAKTLSFIARRPADLVARYGGEEFVVLLPETAEEHALRLAQLCQSAVVEQDIPHEASAVKDVVTISVGVCSVEVTAGMQAKALIEAADKAQYQAKKNGRNRVEVL